MKTLIAKDFNLKHTLECGQFFRFYEKNGFYYINTEDNFFKIKQEGNKLLYEGVNKEINKKFIVHFFNLNQDYKKIIKSISKDKDIKAAIKKYYGLRIINQEPWECTISYVCSQFSNIPKIKKNIELLSKFFGEKIENKDFICYAFPEIGKIRNIKKIKRAKTGYRAKYICEINKKISEKEKNFFEKLRKSNYDDAKNALLELPGIGEKVADCILLYSLGFSEAFPVDTWIKRIMERKYFKNKKTPNKKIIKFAQSYFGKHAGYAQQFLYYHGRN